jgi:hypothetical protein
VIKFLLFCAAAFPVLAFLRATVFRRSRALRQAGEDFNRQVGYLALGMIGVAGLALLFYVYQLLVAR